MVNNIVKKEVLREVQRNALATIAESMVTSFGPMGSDSQLCQDQAMNNKNADPFAVNIYSKDGHTILQSIKFDDIISDAVKSNLLSITTNQVKKIGDGTTSAGYMAYLVFDKLSKIEADHKMPPRVLVSRFEKAVKLVQAEIKKRKQEFDAEAAYKIAYISSNGNQQVANDIKAIYDEFGTDVFIDVAPSLNQQTFVRKFNGLTLDTGYDNPAFINDYKANNCVIDNPRIYYFQDPVDNSEQLSFLISIIEHNIIKPYQEGLSSEAKPTVIFTKHISKDITTQLNVILQFMNQFSKPEAVALKPKLLIVNNIHQDEALDDLAVLCGCPPIVKFNDIKEQDRLQKEGKAPTIKNVCEYYGVAKSVRSDSTSTVIIDPDLMYDEEGKFSNQYEAMLGGLKSQLINSEENGEDLNVLGKLKKRINSLNSKSVEYFVGGITPSVRDALKYLVEDAVLNCRSASKDGVGYAANAEGYIAVTNILDEMKDSDLTKEGADLVEMLQVIKESYVDVITKLYSSFEYKETIEEILEKTEEFGPMNVVTGVHDKNIISSIETDAAILECISRVVTLMITCAQCILPNSTYNKYDNFTF